MFTRIYSSNIHSSLTDVPFGNGTVTRNLGLGTTLNFGTNGINGNLSGELSGANVLTYSAGQNMTGNLSFNDNLQYDLAKSKSLRAGDNSTVVQGVTNWISTAVGDAVSWVGDLFPDSSMTDVAANNLNGASVNSPSLSTGTDGERNTEVPPGQTDSQNQDTSNAMLGAAYSEARRPEEEVQVTLADTAGNDPEEDSADEEVATDESQTDPNTDNSNTAASPWYSFLGSALGLVGLTFAGRGNSETNNGSSNGGEKGPVTSNEISPTNGKQYNIICNGKEVSLEEVNANTEGKLRDTLVELRNQGVYKGDIESDIPRLLNELTTKSFTDSNFSTEINAGWTNPDPNQPDLQTALVLTNLDPSNIIIDASGRAGIVDNPTSFLPAVITQHNGEFYTKPSTENLGSGKGDVLILFQRTYDSNTDSWAERPLQKVPDDVTPESIFFQKRPSWAPTYGDWKAMPSQPAKPPNINSASF